MTYKPGGDDDTVRAGGKDCHSHATRQAHTPVHHHSLVPVQQAAAEPFAEQSCLPAAQKMAKPASEPAVNTAQGAQAQAQAHRVHATVVSYTQPAQRTKAGFKTNASFPPSYVARPVSTAGITIGRPEANK